ncbi:MAG: hypothetical protein H0U21_16545 [Acidimicrobiia bacterium]|nr:hypothetical protein [Acidimicrobiia bacterium]
MAREPAAPTDTAPTRTLVLRLWLPDRAGALGQVASRIGAVHGDVVAIDILERGAGRVIDELVVSLPESTSEELLAQEVGAVDGVAVEQIWTAAGDRPDSATAMLELAAAVRDAPPDAWLTTLADGLAAATDADWAVVVRGDTIVRRSGQPPDAGWLVAFLDGSEHLDAAASGAPGDVLWARLPRSGLAVAAGRSNRGVHDRERARVALLARSVDGR